MTRLVGSLVGLVSMASVLVQATLDPHDIDFVMHADRAANDSLLWGTYRPNLYFGTRTRFPESLMTGLIWFDGGEFQGFQRARHACDQGDGLNGYGYHQHDGRSYGMQQIKDGPSNVQITTEFIKVPGGDHGGDWGVRIRGEPMNSQVPSTTTIIFYAGLEGQGSMDIVSKLSRKGLKSPIQIEGDTPDLGDFEIEIVDGPLNVSPEQGIDQDLSRTQWWGLQVKEGDIWRAKDIIMPRLLMSAREKIAKGSPEDAMAHPYSYFTLDNTLTEEEDEVANMYAFQKIFHGQFQFDVIFRSASSPKKLSNELMGPKIKEKSNEFQARFETTFHLKEKGFSDKEIEFAQFLLSNMLGGIGYFYGSSIVDRSHGPLQDEESFAGEPLSPQYTSPQSLFTATPSRPFFPRGFYWDEGFHELVIGKWDNDLSLDIIKHWISLIDENGWVGREQILGDEARSKVPSEFQTQFPHYANPPTLYLAIKRYVDRFTHQQGAAMMEGSGATTMSSFDDPAVLRNFHLENAVLGHAWLDKVYPKMKLNWEWFRKTQRGHLARFGRKTSNQEAYRWRGRTAEHTLTSGLDDYPRGEPPNVGELHADLMAWMTFATRLLKDIATELGKQEDAQQFAQIELDMLENLDALHWNEEQQAYCDQTVEDGKPVHVCHKGYLSLFPLALGLVPADSPKLGAILEMIRNEDELWSPYGLRSLSASDEYYNTGEVYWRGPIWINMNYLTLQGLYNNYMNTPGPYQKRAKEIYTELRNNIINTVYKDYAQTGYVWEQYSDSTGKGQRSHPFTGWTSLVLLIMAEQYS
ncbi:glycoside hydrolase family 63 protein [Lichtheimia corymbifera JMRC:FSU:9682]|uniref:Mannosyl-oligosaccharide glucosidase n=1 Tax=Lichtheimia corymbifera JMRC:FSU:9682 TaxID=1263082 RepID=A0A068RLC4_9FUNG|nr:glycoside hydrolase family 63 protein [Lichtheimia corymbifera JMRC:FSU:9682]